LAVHYRSVGAALAGVGSCACWKNGQPPTCWSSLGGSRKARLRSNCAHKLAGWTLRRTLINGEQRVAVRHNIRLHGHMQEGQRGSMVALGCGQTPIPLCKFFSARGVAKRGGTPGFHGYLALALHAWSHAKPKHHCSAQYLCFLFCSALGFCSVAALCRSLASWSLTLPVNGPSRCPKPVATTSARAQCTRQPAAAYFAYKKSFLQQWQLHTTRQHATRGLASHPCHKAKKTTNHRFQSPLCTHAHLTSRAPLHPSEISHRHCTAMRLEKRPSCSEQASGAKDLQLASG
jgi:hypothetical protein